MQVLRSVHSMREACAAAKRRAANGAPGSSLGLVPTMGALHEGHLSLVRSARQQCATVAVSIFVNPTQFAPNEDYDRYPQTFAADCALLERAGVDLLFAPTAREMYPNGLTATTVDVPEVGSRLDGHSRPGHFRGVATVVSKLFHIVSPELAFFGQKDAAQVAVLQAMVRDLDMPVRLCVCATVREPSGLALSSRNRYLSAAEREQALALVHSLRQVERLAAGGTHDAATLQAALRAMLESAPGVELEYAEVVAPDTLLPVRDLRGGALVAVAAKVGSTRLIDNILLPPSEDGAPSKGAGA